MLKLSNILTRTCTCISTPNDVSCDIHAFLHYIKLKHICSQRNAFHNLKKSLAAHCQECGSSRLQKMSCFKRYINILKTNWVGSRVHMWFEPEHVHFGSELGLFILEVVLFFTAVGWGFRGR